MCSEKLKNCYSRKGITLRIIYGLNLNVSINTLDNVNFLKEMKMKNILVALVLFSVSFFSFQPLAQDNKGYYVGQKEENKDYHLDFGEQVRVIARTEDHEYLLIEAISGDLNSKFLVSTGAVISQNELRNSYIFDKVSSIDNRVGYFREKEKGYKNVTAIRIRDESMKVTMEYLPFHILKNNVTFKECTLVSGYSELRNLGLNPSGEMVVEVMNVDLRSTGIAMSSGNEFELCVNGDHLTIPKQHYSKKKEEGRYIGQRAYYIGDIKKRDCELFGVELTIVGESEQNLFAQIDSPVECERKLLMFYRHSYSKILSFPVVNY